VKTQLNQENLRRALNNTLLQLAAAGQLEIPATDFITDPLANIRERRLIRNRPGIQLRRWRP
jgi:hypothetical protein